MAAKPIVHLCEADVAEGLEEIAREELRNKLGRQVTVRQPPAAQALRGIVQFTHTGDLRALTTLKTVQAVFVVKRFAVPRPKALLGDEHFRAILDLIEQARSTQPDTFRSLYLSAAGSDSSVMRRLKHELSQRTHLVLAEEGDLLVRVRPSLWARPDTPSSNMTQKDRGWDVLVRLSPRPLATRSWRVCNFEGALNAAVAHAMALLTRPTAQDVFLNLACGSGTLLIERLTCAPARLAVGCDMSREALDCAQRNVAAAGCNAILWQCDGQRLPLADHSVDVVCADLPFGHLVGSHGQNVTLYPRLLAEAARVAKPGARFALITHEVRLTESLLAASQAWLIDRTVRVELGGLHPRIYLLRRSG
ncbi:MAG: methyltransferase domain-containing protein [Anaerolineae bacterium]|nr:methyltransferase domain-containing protein [Thermoflexales bacterium]MDW8407073.1 methyltransferase domain-containing protein [Anaerolineae bacterium]